MTKIGNIEYLDWEPQAVACSRGKFGSQRYDAEVKFLDKQYFISGNHPTRDAAMAIATNVVTKLTDEIKAAGAKVLGGYREAKP